MKKYVDIVKNIFTLGKGAIFALITFSFTALHGNSVTQVTTVAGGLNCPRGLTYYNNALYVAESGLGAGTSEPALGVGFTGSITQIMNLYNENPLATRIVKGLASIGEFEGPSLDILGPSGVSIHSGNLYTIIGLSSGGVFNSYPSIDPDLTGMFGHLLKIKLDKLQSCNVKQNGRTCWRSIADVGDFNYVWTLANANAPFAPFDPGNPPVPQFPDANTVDVLAVDKRQYVIDAGANTLNEVRQNRTVRILAYFPNDVEFGDAVPTCVAQGPDGFLYCGTLAFVANAQSGGTGKSKIYRINPNSLSPTPDFNPEVWADGFGPITGCGFGKDNAFYVTEFTTNFPVSDLGQVVRIHIQSDGSAGKRTYLGYGSLHSPYGFAVDSKGSIYVSNNSTSGGNGEVVRVIN